MFRLKLVASVLLTVVAVVDCRARQLNKRLESGLEWDRLEKKSLDSRPVDMEALFWSYFYRGSVERAGLVTGGYTRASPDQWEGRASMRSNPRDKVLLLGEMARVSEGPRRRKREVRRSQGGKEVKQPGWSGDVRLKDGQDRLKVDNWQRRDIFQPNLPRQQQWRACTLLCRTSRPPPPFPPCCAPLDQPLTSWGRWVGATEQFVHSYPLAVIAIQTVFSIAVINVLVSRLGGGAGEVDVSGRSWDTGEQEGESERLLLQVLDGNWLSALEEHAIEKKKKRESYICCLLNEGEEEQVECFTQPQHSGSGERQLKFRFFTTC